MTSCVVNTRQAVRFYLYCFSGANMSLHLGQRALSWKCPTKLGVRSEHAAHASSPISPTLNLLDRVSSHASCCAEISREPGRAKRTLAFAGFWPICLERNQHFPRVNLFSRTHAPAWVHDVVLGFHAELWSPPPQGRPCNRHVKKCLVLFKKTVPEHVQQSLAIFCLNGNSTAPHQRAGQQH